MLERLRSVRVHVLHAARDRAGLTRALERQLTDDGYHVLVFGPDQAGDLLAALSGHLPGRSGRPAAVLAGDASLQGAVIVVQPHGLCSPELQAFARAVRHQPGESGPRVLVVADDTASVLDGIDTEQVRGVVERLDGAAYAAWLPRSREPLVGELVVAVAIEVAAWDLPLLDRLTALPKTQAVRPDLHVRAWHGADATACAGVPLRWEGGVIDSWSGVDTEHPAWLASNRPAKLTKRVWRGQLAALLPWIELHRLQVVDRHRSALRPVAVAGGGAEPPDVDLLDWGPLCLQLRGIDAARARAVEPFRFARNELAHGRPIAWPSITACLQHSALLLAPPPAEAGSRFRGG